MSQKIKKQELAKIIETINGVSIIPGDKSLDIEELREVFTGKNIDAKQLRKDAWTRKKQ